MKLFPASGDIMMDLCHDPVELFDEILPCSDKLRSVACKLSIIDLQKAFRVLYRFHFLKQLVFLSQDLVVGTQIMYVNLIQLTELHIHKPAPVRRSVFYDMKIFRRKDHNIRNSEKL